MYILPDLIHYGTLVCISILVLVVFTIFTKIVRFFKNAFEENQAEKAMFSLIRAIEDHEENIKNRAETINKNAENTNNLRNDFIKAPHSKSEAKRLQVLRDSEGQFAKKPTSRGNAKKRKTA